MAGYDGSGVWTRSYSWTQDAANGIKISSGRMDTDWANITAGFNNCLTRDGQGKPSSAIDWNNQNLTGVNNLTVNGTFTLSAGTLTLSGLAVTVNATVGGTLGVTGAATFGAVSATTLGTSGLAALNSCLVSNALTINGTTTTQGVLTMNGAATYLALEVGWRSVPRSTTATTAAIGDRGRCIAVSAGLTVPNAIFAAGDSFSIYNDSAAAVTITQGASLTLRQAGTTGTGNRTLAARGLATVWFNGASEAVITGAGVT